MLLAAACNLEKFPSDALSTDSMKDPGNASTVTDGTYAMFKAILMYNDIDYSANSYVRHFFQMAEFRGDNIVLCAKTTDPLNDAICYTDKSTQGNTGYFWWISYKIILSANTIIEAIPASVETADPKSEQGPLRHILGENYFLRAVAHLNLLQIYANPYSFGTDNPGVVLRTSTKTDVTDRSTVGVCYDQVEKDLIKAAALMKGGSRRSSSNCYASYEAAMGMLSRVQLYMGKWDDCIATVKTMLKDENGADVDPATKLDQDYENLFQNSKTSPEVLWCVAMIPSDWTSQKGSMGSMFYSYDSKDPTQTSAPGGGGWGEIYYSQPLMDLFNRYPQDIRFSTMAEAYQEDKNKTMIYWPLKPKGEDTFFRLMQVDNNPKIEGGELKSCKDSANVSYPIEKRIVNTYPEYHIQYGSEDIRLGVMHKCATNKSYPVVYMKKFCNMGGGAEHNVLNSPIMIRWSEVILNRAEAYAHKNDPKAIDDVNVIRARAGLTGDAQMSDGNRAARGYAGDEGLLDLVLDERRMELCFEGFRPFDLTRNKKDIDRRYGGYNPYELISYDDKRIPYLIPNEEVTVSHITQNPR